MELGENLVKQIVDVFGITTKRVMIIAMIMTMIIESVMFMWIPVGIMVTVLEWL